MTEDERKRAIERDIASYRTQVRQEQIARANGDERHLAAALDAQQRILHRLKQFGLMSVPEPQQEPASRYRPATRPAAPSPAVICEVRRSMLNRQPQ